MYHGIAHVMVFSKDLKRSNAGLKINEILRETPNLLVLIQIHYVCLSIRQSTFPGG